MLLPLGEFTALSISFAIFGPVTECLSVIPLVQGKVHEQRPKHGSGSSEPRCFDLFDLQPWIHRDESSFISRIRLWGWLTCGDLVGDFLNFLTSFQSTQFMIHCSQFMKVHSSQFRKIHGFIHLESSPIISDLWTDVSKIFSSRCRWSRWTKAPPCYVPRGHQSREIWFLKG